MMDITGAKKAVTEIFIGHRFIAIKHYDLVP
jgi:hypothetical protein